MASTMTSLINHNFGGIRRKDSIFSEDKITCSDCQNVELYYTQLNSAVGIRTAKGNVSLNVKISTIVNDKEVLSDLEEGETIVGIYETEQLTTTYYIVYTEYIDNETPSNSEGRLYRLDLYTQKLYRFDFGNTRLAVTGKANGETLHINVCDVFAFSNGEDLVFIYSHIDYPVNPLLIAGINDSSLGNNKLALNLTDNYGSTVKGLGLVNLYGRLWVFNGTKVWYSKVGSPADFNNTQEDTTLVTRAGVIEMSKNITAIHEYLGSLAVFHYNSSCLVVEDSETLFKVTDESPGGCASYDSLVFHGTDLFFYDDTKKGVFSFQQIVNGDKTLSDNIAYDIQDELMSINKNDIDKIRALSVVTSDRNEIWFLTPIEDSYPYEDTTKPASIILIYDYIRGEWVKRKSQKINCIAILSSALYSAGSNIFKEYLTTSFDGDYIQNYYKCTVMNLGTDNTLKITKFPPRLTIDASFKNHFFVKYIKNYSILKKAKIKELISKTFGNIMIWNSGDRYNNGKIFKPGSISGIIKMPSATYKALEIMFYTLENGQSFTIKAIEFSKIKVKQV